MDVETKDYQHVHVIFCKFPEFKVPCQGSLIFMKKVIVDVPSELCIDDGQCDEIGVKSERNKEKKKGLNSDN